MLHYAKSHLNRWIHGLFNFDNESDVLCALDTQLAILHLRLKMQIHTKSDSKINQRRILRREEEEGFV
jgi:hypothetical protein